MGGAGKKLKLQDAVVATQSELKDLADEFGVFYVAENATDRSWTELRRHDVAESLKKTRRQLRNVENALQRLEVQLHSLGTANSGFNIERKFVPLEGWVLTLIDNYASLIAFRNRYDRGNLFDRLGKYTEGAIKNAQGNPAGAREMDKVRGPLQDLSVLYG